MMKMNGNLKMMRWRLKITQKPLKIVKQQRPLQIVIHQRPWNTDTFCTIPIVFVIQLSPQIVFMK